MTNCEWFQKNKCEPSLLQAGLNIKFQAAQNRHKKWLRRSTEACLDDLFFWRNKKVYTSISQSAFCEAHECTDPSKLAITKTTPTQFSGIKPYKTCVHKKVFMMWRGKVIRIGQVMWTTENQLRAAFRCVVAKQAVVALIHRKKEYHGNATEVQEAISNSDWIWQPE